MQINPMDAMRSQEAAQIKHIESSKNQYAQNQIEKNFQNTIKHEMNKPTEAGKSENSPFRYDAKEKGNNQYKGSGNKKKKDSKEEKKDDNKPQNSGGIDILI